MNLLKHPACFLLLLLSLTLLSCDRFSDPYAASEDALPQEVSVQLIYPEGFAEVLRAGTLLRFENIGNAALYSARTDADGRVQVALPKGIYRISAQDRVGQDLFNGSLDHVVVAGDALRIDLPLTHSLAGTLVVRELYVGGCSKAPEEGTWQADQYVLLHSNDPDPVYLDGLCFGTLTPYNATGVNHWLGADGSLPDFAPVVTVVWKFPGSGTDHPLGPGEDALIALRGAIDHTAQYPLSVNLNRSDCYVCYNETYFPNPTYHPAPGDQIRADHILEVAIKTGQSNANVVSITSPAFLIFRPKGMTIEDYLQQPDVVVATPGSSSDIVVKVPYEWVIDAVEVFDGRSTANGKRFPAQLDAGFVTQSEPFKGHSLIRRVDEAESEEKGFVILKDSNNSSEDFYESETASLHAD